jgi:hypothetical protein
MDCVFDLNRNDLSNVNIPFFLDRTCIFRTLAPTVVRVGAQDEFLVLSKALFRFLSPVTPLVWG